MLSFKCALVFIGNCISEIFDSLSLEYLSKRVTGILALAYRVCHSEAAPLPYVSQLLLRQLVTVLSVLLTLQVAL